MKEPDTTKRLEEALSDVQPEEKEALRAMWRLSGGADDDPDISPAQINTLWQQLSSATALQAEQAAPPSPRKDRRPIRRSSTTPKFGRWVGAAMGVALLSIGIAFLLSPIVKTAPYGERIAANLPDGSTIELNSGSSITYPRFFRGTRTIVLEGEAYFDVTESDVPFIVETFNAEVQVLGTTFNVSAWSDGWTPMSQVTLASGSVRLSAVTSPDQSIIMEPGQTVSVQQGVEGFVVAESMPVDYALAWRKGELVFKDQPLATVLREIERRFSIDIDLITNQLATKEVTFAYRQATSAENVIEDLSHALGLKYRAISTGYELFEE